MKLKEIKEKYTGNIKLGAKGGAAFFFCGRIETMDFNAIEEECTNKIKSLLQKADRAVLLAEDTPLDRVAYERFKVRSHRDIAYSVWLEMEKASRARKKRYAESLERKIKDYPHIAEREVVELYKSVEPDTIIVLVEGKEVGKAWTTEEYINGEV